VFPLAAFTRSTEAWSMATGSSRGEDPDIVDNGRIRKSITIAGRRNLGKEVEIERLSLLAVDRSAGVFDHLLLEDRDALIPLVVGWIRLDR